MYCDVTCFDRFLWNSYKKLFEYLEIDTNIILSSSIEKDNSLRGKDKVIAICHALGADTYYNAIGGQELYDKVEFADNGVDLHFVKTDDITYQQFGSEFEPELSIIDVLMFYGKIGTRLLLFDYSLI